MSKSTHICFIISLKKLTLSCLNGKWRFIPNQKSIEDIYGRFRTFIPQSRKAKPGKCKDEPVRKVVETARLFDCFGPTAACRPAPRCEKRFPKIRRGRSRDRRQQRVSRLPLEASWNKCSCNRSTGCLVNKKKVLRSVLY